jgi:hypothetical protein
MEVLPANLTGLSALIVLNHQVLKTIRFSALHNLSRHQFAHPFSAFKTYPFHGLLKNRQLPQMLPRSAFD